MSSHSAPSRNSSLSSPVSVAASTRTSRAITGQNRMMDGGPVKH